MSTATAAGPPAPTRSGRTRRPLHLAGALLLAWVLPLLTHLLAVDWLVPIAVLVAVAGLLRGLPTLLDRAVASLAQAFGALCVAGLLFSVWPWRLHPVAMGGAALTAVVGYAAVTGRRWSLPRRFAVADRLTALAAAAVGLLAAVPFLTRDLGGRIGIVATGEDMGRHLMLTDVIGLVGGYAFLHPNGAERYLAEGIEAGLRTYPQGTHFAYAVLSRFLRSSGGSTDAVSQAGITIWLYVATFAFLALSVLWGVRRVAGPAFADLAGALRLLPVLTVAGAWLVFGDPLAVFARGYPNQLTAMALVAVLTAVVVRPLPRFGDQLTLLVLVLVGLSFTYHLYLPYAGLAVAVWAARAGRWRRGRRLVAALATVVVAAPVLLLTPVLTLQAASVANLGTAGTALPIDRPATVLLIGMALAAQVVRGGLRSPARRTGLAVLAAAALVTAALGLYQVATVGRTVYYFEKLAHAGIIVGIVLLGMLARAVPGYGVRADIARWRPAATALTPALVLCLVLAGLGGPRHTRPGSLGARLLAGIEAGSPSGGHDAVSLARRYPDGAGRMTVDVAGAPYRAWFGTYFGSVLQRTYRYGHAWYGFLNPANPPRTLSQLENLVAASPVPVRLVVSDPQARTLLTDPAHEWTNGAVAEHLATRYPDKVEVVQAAA